MGSFSAAACAWRPNATPDDGVFDVVVMGGATERRALADMKLIYTGEHIANADRARAARRKIVAAPVAETTGRPVLIEVGWRKRRPTARDLRNPAPRAQSEMLTTSLQVSQVAGLSRNF